MRPRKRRARSAPLAARLAGDALLTAAIPCVTAFFVEVCTFALLMIQIDITCDLK